MQRHLFEKNFSHGTYNHLRFSLFHQVHTLCTKATIHQVNTILVSSKMSYFQVIATCKPLVLMNLHFNYHTCWCSCDTQNVGSSVPVVSRWLWPGKRTLLKLDSMVGTWWIVALLQSGIAMLGVQGLCDELELTWHLYTWPTNIIKPKPFTLSPSPLGEHSPTISDGERIRDGGKVLYCLPYSEVDRVNLLFIVFIKQMQCLWIIQQRGKQGTIFLPSWKMEPIIVVFIVRTEYCS